MNLTSSMKPLHYAAGMSAKKAKIGRQEAERTHTSCLPHPDVITKASDYDHFESEKGRMPLPFAIAEKIDNAIAATVGNKGARNIDVYFLYDNDDKLQYIVVRDNGKGMSMVDARAYMTYFYAQDRRIEDGQIVDRQVKAADSERASALDPRFSIDGQIGHFGVGGQNSAFFLGGGEQFITCKPKDAKDKNMKEPVTEATITAQGMMQRWQEHRITTYDFQFNSRQIGSNHLLEKTVVDNPVVDRLIEEREAIDYKEGNGFSMFIIIDIKKVHQDRLNPDNKSRTPTEKDYREILHHAVLADLARIYHYYIHGVNGDEELPAEINEDDEDYRQEDDADTAPVEAKRKVPEAAASSGLGSAKKKARQEHMQHDASHVNIVIHAYKGENLIFKQNLQEVSTVEVELMHKRKDTLALYLRIHPKAGSCKFPLYLYYCPYILERETRPADTYEQPPDEPIYNKPIISSYWQGRWVPYAEMNNLEIFKGSGIQEDLLKRLRGTAFFSRNMTPVNSKLHFSEPVTTLLNCKEGRDSLEYFANWKDEVPVSQSMARVKRRIKEWIDECHAKYDREISVGGIMKGIFKAPDFTSETRFTVMGYGKDEDGEDIFYRQDDKIILPTKPRKFGIVKYFACAELSPGKTVTGKACIVYTRHPTRLYGEDNETREQVSVKLQPVASDKWMVEVRKFEERIPTKLTVYAAGADMGRNSTFRKSLFESKDFSNILGKKTILQAGYALPEIHVFALSLNGAPINEVPDSRSDKKTKLKILRKVTKLTDDAHARDTGTDGRIGKGLGSVLTDSNDYQDVPEKVGSYFFTKVERLFEGAGEYEISFSVDNKDFKDIKWSHIVKIGAAEPHEAEIELNPKEASPEDLRLGVQKCSIKFAFHDKFRDKETASKYMKGNLITKLPEGVTARATSVEPSNLQITFDAPQPIKDEPGYANLSVTVKPLTVEGVQEMKQEIKQLKKAKTSPLDASCSIIFDFEQGKSKGEGKKSCSIESVQEVSFKVFAGLPKILAFEDDKIEKSGIECDNNTLMPEFTLRARDKYGYPVFLEDDDHIDIKAELSYVGTDPKAKKRRPLVYEAKMTSSSMMTGSSITLGGKLVNLADPIVSHPEDHELKIMAEANVGGKRGKKVKSCRLAIKVHPSYMPHSARAFHRELGGLLMNKDSQYIVDVEAGSKAKGIYFKLYDEAGREVKDLSGCKVKWPGTGKWAKLGEGDEMPPKECRTKANDETPLVVTFMASNENIKDATFTAELTLIPYPAAPASWDFCDPSNGRALKNITIPCDKALHDIVALELKDVYDNSIDLRVLNRDATGSNAIVPQVAVVRPKGATGLHKAVEKRGDWKTFTPFTHSSGRETKHMLRFQPDCSLRNEVGEWEFILKTASGVTSTLKISDRRHKFTMTAGPPVSMRVTLTGLPYEMGQESCSSHVFLGGGSTPEAQPMSMGMMIPVEPPSLRDFPSTSVIQKIEVQLLDESGNVVEISGIRKVQKDVSVTLSLSGGRVGQGNQKEKESISKKFGSDVVSFKQVVVSAGCDEGTGQMLATGNLMIECGMSCIDAKEVAIPLKFSQMNRVRSVKILPDPYPANFKIGEKLGKVLVNIQTEDGMHIDFDKEKYAECLKINCWQVDSHGEESDVFDSIRAEEDTRENPNVFYFMPGSGSLTRIGQHQIQLTYTELRPSIRGMLGDDTKLKSNVLNFNVAAGKPYTIEPRRELHVALSSKKSVLVSNSEDIENKNSKRKILIRPLVLHVSDLVGNPCVGESDLCVVASIEFDDLADEGGDDPTYDIECYSGFAFENDAEKARQKADLGATVKEKKLDVKKLQEGFHQRDRSFKKLEDKLKAAGEDVERARHALSNLGLNPNDYPDQKSCQDSIDIIQNNRGQAIGRRVTRIDNNLKAHVDQARAKYGRKILGLLAELICVEDSDEARIIAAYSRSAMETLVVQDRATQVDMARHHEFKHVRCISLETCRQFRGPTNMIKGSPRLEVLQRRHDYAWVNEMHAVNIIDFHYPDHEYLRAKVVFGLLPKFLVVPFSFEEMGERRRVAQAQHVDLPDMIDKREGRVWRSSGVTGGKDSEISNKWPATFPGQRDNSEAQKQALINLRDKMAASHDLSNEFKEASNWTEERARLQREIQDLDKEYKLVLAKYQALNSPSVDESGVASAALVPPELDFLGQAPPRPQGAIERLGPFVFPVDSKGVATLENLGIKNGVGNKEGPYKLKCRLHNKVTGEPLLREEPGKKSAVLHISDDS